MLVRLENVSIEFIFDTDRIHHIEVKEGDTDKFVMYLDDLTPRVLTMQQYNKLLDVLYSENCMRDV